jgi:hypothetical protein
MRGSPDESRGLIPAPCSVNPSAKFQRGGGFDYDGKTLIFRRTNFPALRWFDRRHGHLCQPFGLPAHILEGPMLKRILLSGAALTAFVGLAAAQSAPAPADPAAPPAAEAPASPSKAPASSARTTNPSAAFPTFWSMPTAI